MESLWIDAKAKVDVKVADTKFLMLRDVLLSTNGEGKQNYFFRIISERVILYNLTTLAQFLDLADCQISTTEWIPNR